MKKKITIVTLTLISYIVCSFGFVACSANVDGTYYFYDNEQYYKTDYITLKNKEWNNADNMGGEFSIFGENITLYVELFGKKEEIASGIVKNGVLTLDISGQTFTYCKQGKKPSGGDVQLEPTISEFGVGSDAPDFSLKMYGNNEDGHYSLLDENFVMEDHFGEVIVVNFWATWCGPCIEKLPEFAEVADECNVTIVAIHGRIIGTDNDQPEIWIPSHHPEWIDSKLIFLQDEMDGSTAKTFVAYGGVNSYPITVIVGKDGKVTFTMQGRLDKATLKREVEKAQNA